MRRIPPQGDRAAHSGSFPYRIGGVEPDDAVVHSDNRVDAIEVKFSNAAPRESEQDVPLRRVHRIRPTAQPQLTFQTGRELSAGERGKIQLGKPQEQVLRPPGGRLECGEPMCIYDPNLPAEGGIDGEPSQGALALEVSSHLAASSKRGKGPPDSLE